jgi:hypothetical protein
MNRKPWIAALVVIAVVAAGLYLGGPMLWHALLRMHGRH